MLTEIQRGAGEQLDVCVCVCVRVCLLVCGYVCVCVCVLGQKHVSRDLKCADCEAMPTAVKDWFDFSIINSPDFYRCGFVALLVLLLLFVSISDWFYCCFFISLLVPLLRIYSVGLIPLVHSFIASKVKLKLR